MSDYFVHEDGNGETALWSRRGMTGLTDRDCQVIAYKRELDAMHPDMWAAALAKFVPAPVGDSGDVIERVAERIFRACYPNSPSDDWDRLDTPTRDYWQEKARQMDAAGLLAHPVAPVDDEAIYIAVGRVVGMDASLCERITASVMAELRDELAARDRECSSARRDVADLSEWLTQARAELGEVTRERDVARRRAETWITKYHDLADRHGDELAEVVAELAKAREALAERTAERDRLVERNMLLSLAQPPSAPVAPAKRGGHTSGSKPYASLPEVSTRPAVGAWHPISTLTGQPCKHAADMRCVECIGDDEFRFRPLGGGVEGGES